MRSIQSDLDETQGFAFVEFVSQDALQLGKKLISLGFGKKGQTLEGDKVLYSQGDINFIVNNNVENNAGEYREKHKQGASALAFYVNDPQQAYINSIKKGSEPAANPDYSFPALQGVGGGVIYLVEKDSFKSTMDALFLSASTEESISIGLKNIDHLTHNVSRGAMSAWEKFYANVFSFRRIKTFDIKGTKTGLRSVAMESPNGRIKIPINESSDENSQIEEFLRLNEGEGIQHIALSTDDIYATIEQLRALGVEFQETPDSYYELLEKRHPNHGENTEALHRLGILLDSDNEDKRSKLLQIFTKETIGPMFFEIIQRKGNQGFGEGNFQALFESIELDQMRRGVI